MRPRPHTHLLIYALKKWLWRPHINTGEARRTHYNSIFSFSFSLSPFSLSSPAFHSHIIPAPLPSVPNQSSWCKKTRVWGKMNSPGHLLVFFGTGGMTVLLKHSTPHHSSKLSFRTEFHWLSDTPSSLHRHPSPPAVDVGLVAEVLAGDAL